MFNIYASYIPRKDIMSPLNSVPSCKMGTNTISPLSVSSRDNRKYNHPYCRALPVSLSIYTVEQHDPGRIFIHSSLQAIARILNHQINACNITRLVKPTIARRCELFLRHYAGSNHTRFSLQKYIISSPDDNIFEIAAVYSMGKKCIALTGRVEKHHTFLWTDMVVLHSQTFCALQQVS